MYDELTVTPAALERALAPDAEGRDGREALAARLASAERVYLTGCGTAYHAALVGACFLREFTRGRVDARAVEAFELAHYERPGPSARDVVIGLSHSGRPSATNAALARARAAGCYRAVITGNRESPAALGPISSSTPDSRPRSRWPTPSATA